MQLDRDDHRGMSSGAHGKETACKNSLGIVTSRNITIGMLRQVDSSNQDKTIEEILLESCPDRDTYSKERFDYEIEEMGTTGCLQALALKKKKKAVHSAVFLEENRRRFL